MVEPTKRAMIVAGNVYFCNFRKAVSCMASGKGEALFHDTRDVRLTAETIQHACRDLIAGAPLLVRRAELNAADLVSVASMIDELAFQAHVMVIHGEDVVGMDAGSLQHALMEAAAVTIELQGCMSAANDSGELLLRRLREQAQQALHLGRRLLPKHSPPV
jgi:hypothetical protein